MIFANMNVVWYFLALSVLRKTKITDINQWSVNSISKNVSVWLVNTSMVLCMHWNFEHFSLGSWAYLLCQNSSRTFVQTMQLIFVSFVPESVLFKYSRKFCTKVWQGRKGMILAMAKESRKTILNFTGVDLSQFF